MVVSVKSNYLVAGLIGVVLAVSAGGGGVGGAVGVVGGLIGVVLAVSGVEGQVRVSVDGGRVGAPISKYVYGQFAEHLGRSIYGGLWAEMVEDRKFGREITNDYKPFDLANDWFGKPSAFVYLKNSPWKVIGPKGTVT